ncbi:MAG: glycosyltransferase [Saprospiraceae bacterium]
MLSILIPVYNFDIRPLVADLHGQCEASGKDFEIVCFDDGSSESFKKTNREIRGLEHLVYRELEQNLGRSAIRNALGKAARFPFLLFMDCDSKVVRKDFIQNYLAHLQPGALVYGGRSYGAQPPVDDAFYFHWLYGINREQSTAEQRRKFPYHSFMTNNFLVPSDIFLHIGFDETLTQYGHEDTLFGMELAKHNIPIVHIDNPLEHIGLEPAAVFLKKTRQGLENLALLWYAGKLVDTKLLRTFLALQRLGMQKPMAWLFSKTENSLVQNFTTKHPSLRLFDLYKLGYFARLIQQKP